MPYTFIRITADHRNYTEEVKPVNNVVSTDGSSILTEEGYKQPLNRVWSTYRGKTSMTFCKVVDGDPLPSLRKLRLTMMNYLSSQGYRSSLMKAGKFIGEAQRVERSVVNA